MRNQKYIGLTIILIITLVIAGPLFNVSASPLKLGTAPSLGTAQSFVAMGGSTLTNTGSSTINGDLGVWPGLAYTGFPPGAVTPPYAIHDGDAIAQQAQNDITTAFNALSQPVVSDLTGQDLGILTLTPGVYSFSSSAQLTGTLTLDAGGDPNAVFIFLIGSTLTTASGSSVNIINSGSACNLFWQVGSSATLGTTTAFQGTIIALQSITLNTGASIIPGRALARNGALTLDTNTINGTICTTPPAPVSTPTSTQPAVDQPTETPIQFVPGLPGTGGAPIRNDHFPWSLLFAGSFGALMVVLGVRMYYRGENQSK